MTLKAENLHYNQKSGHMSYPLLSGLSLEIRPGLFRSVAAPLGAGKSVLMKILAGLISAEQGEIAFYGLPGSDSEHSGKKIKTLVRGDIPLVTSEASSYPWLSVIENVEFALRESIPEKKARRKEAERYAEMAGLEGYEDFYPDEKSTGFRFRISLARALAAGKKYLLIDEPFRNTDEETTVELLMLLRDIFLKEQLGVLYATSSVREALFLSDEILIMKSRPLDMSAVISPGLGRERPGETLNSEAFRQKLNEIEQTLVKENLKMKDSFIF